MRAAVSVVVSLLAAATLGGCGVASSGHTMPIELDSNGHIVAYTLVYRPGTRPASRPATVPARYAILIDCLNPQARYFVYNVDSRQVFRTGSFDAFLAAVDRLPEGVEVAQVEKCTVPFSWGLPTEDWKRLTDAMKRGQRRWMINPRSGNEWFGDCTCEAVELRLPGDPPVVDASATSRPSQAGGTSSLAAATRPSSSRPAPG